jgi:FkbM family methyltransferase
MRWTVSRRALLVYGIAGILGVAALASAWRWGRPARPSSAAAAALPDWTAPIDVIRDSYGPKQYSQGEEETLIRAFFQDRRAGFFLDVGASHYEKDSTTYYLEQHLGWRGIAIDALEEFRADYERHRKGTQFFTFFVTNRAELPKDFYVFTKDTRISSGSLEWLHGLRVKDRNIRKIQVPSITLNQLLAAQRVEKVDFVSMDIEGAEPEALEGFDLERYRPELLCVEIQTHTRDRLLAYLASHGYVPIEPYRQVDPVNLYFRRKA